MTPIDRAIERGKIRIEPKQDGSVDIIGRHYDARRFTKAIKKRAARNERKATRYQARA